MQITVEYFRYEHATKTVALIFMRKICVVSHKIFVIKLNSINFLIKIDTQNRLQGLKLMPFKSQNPFQILEGRTHMCVWGIEERL